jgi:putative transposase
MPRGPRKPSTSGIHHVMSRGIDKRNIFLSDEDFIKFLSIMKKTQEKHPFTLYAYCLMHNHFHLLIQPNADELGVTIQRISSVYALYHNQAHQRFGHLFQNRFKSEPIEGDEHFLTVLRYIHQNPIKAQLVKDLHEYPWSSYCEYAGSANMVSTAFAHELIGSKEKLLHLIEIPMEQESLDIESNRQLNDKDLKWAVQSIISVEELHAMTKEVRDRYLRLIKTKTGASNRRLAQYLGFSPRLIDRVLK